MASTKTRQVNIAVLQRRPETATLVVKLMMACNDLSLANEALTWWKAGVPRLHQHRQAGAKMYFARLQFSHLYEALDAVRDIASNAELMNLLAQCDVQTRHSFSMLREYAPGGVRRQVFERHVGQIRSNLVFHYETAGKPRRGNQHQSQSHRVNRRRHRRQESGRAKRQARS